MRKGNRHARDLGWRAPLDGVTAFSCALGFYLVLGSDWGRWIDLGGAALLSEIHASISESGFFLNSLLTALTVFLFHAGARILGLSRREGFLLAAVLAVTPAVIFQAVRGGGHGAFRASTGVGFLLTALLITRPSARVALVLGLSMGLSSGVHVSGLLLPCLFLPWFVQRNGKLFPGIYDRAFLVGLALLGTWAGICSLLLLHPSSREALEQLTLMSPPPVGGALPILQGFLVAFFPILLVFPALFCSWEGIKQNAWLWVAFLPFLWLALGQGEALPGKGGFFLPLVFTGILCVREHLPRMAFTTILAIGLAFGGLHTIQQKLTGPSEGGQEKEVSRLAEPPPSSFSVYRR